MKGAFWSNVQWKIINTIDYRLLRAIYSLKQAAVDWLQQQRWCNDIFFTISTNYFLHLHQQQGGWENTVMNSTYLGGLVHPLLIRKIANENEYLLRERQDEEACFSWQSYTNRLLGQRELPAGCWLGSLSQWSFDTINVFFRVWVGDVSVIHFPPANSVISLILKNISLLIPWPRHLETKMLPPRLTMGIIMHNVCVWDIDAYVAERMGPSVRICIWSTNYCAKVSSNRNL